MKRRINRALGILMAAAVALSAMTGPVLPTKAAGTIPVYRLNNPKTGEHLFTTDTNEVRYLSTQSIWENEGLAWNSSDSGVPVYRLNNPKGYHLYTADLNEINHLTQNSGWLMDNNNKPMFYSSGNVSIYRLYQPNARIHLLTADQNEYNYLSTHGWNGEGVSVMAQELKPTTQTPVVNGKALNYEYVRGVWFSFLDWQTYLKGKNESAFKTAFTKVCDTVLENGCNTMYVHVRSHNDAVYPSDIYPWSEQMLSGVPKFDPLKTMIEIAHSKNISFQAWINPYGYRNGAFSGDESLVNEANIIAGIKEIVANYDVDGIHFDDYFPTYEKSVHNSMIKKAYQTAHDYGKIFGISPQGNIGNNRSMGADIDTWLSQEGYIDYITPQIYWTDQYGTDGTTTMYTNTLNQWIAINKLNIPIYVGLALYRTNNSYKGDPGWLLSSQNLATQIRKANAAGCKGYIYFKYTDFDRAGAATELYNARGL